MSDSSSNRWLCRYAVLTAAVALLPIGMGALVTTLDAGMAFLDWPTSDGQNMFLYPWLKDFSANKEKFVEHGHRLAGSLIGMFSIGLVVFTIKRESRAWVRGLAVAILAAVVLQGLLGGFRVIADARVAALMHGLFASLIFTTITMFALVTGAKWHNPKLACGVASAPRYENSTSQCNVSVNRGADAAPLACVSNRMKYLVVATPIVVFGQSLLGGLVRHLNLGLHEHLSGAILTTVLAVSAIVVSWRSGLAWLRSPSIVLAVVMLIQLMLGAGAWVTRFGFPPTGYVAVQQAPEQILFRTAHTVAAIFVLMLSVQLAVRVLRVNWLSRRGAGFQPADFPTAAELESFSSSRLKTCSTIAGAMP